MIELGEEFEIVGARILTPQGVRSDVAIQVRDGAITEVGAPSETADYPRLDAGGLLVAPGLVDLHGDAFERQIMPRPGVRFPLDLALGETDRQLVANGITTAFHAVTFSWEPGLRSRETTAQLLDALDRRAANLACDTRLHLRFEIDNLDGLADGCRWLEDGRIGLLAFNDHTEHMRVKAASDPEELLTYTQRTGLSVEDFRALLGEIWARRPDIPGAVERLAGVARGAGVPMLSHDDPCPKVRAYYHGLGAEIAEFPKTEETAKLARDNDTHVVMGSPNVVRGGSHTNAVTAADMVSKGLCSILTSDYYYPAMLPAALILARDGLVTLPEAWALVSGNPAAAAGLEDRGSLEAGKRADIILLDDSDRATPVICATLIGGHVAYARTLA